MASFFCSDVCQWKKVTKYLAANIMLRKMCCKQQKLLRRSIYDFKFKNNYNIYVWGSEESWYIYSKMFVLLKQWMYLYCLYASFVIWSSVMECSSVTQTLYSRSLRRQSKTWVRRIWLENMCVITQTQWLDYRHVISAPSLTNSTACEDALALKSVISLTSNDLSVNQTAKLLLHIVLGHTVGGERDKQINLQTE